VPPVGDGIDIAIAGGGLAGLTAGMFAARLGHSATVLTGLAPGGLLLSIEQIEGVPGFPEGVPGYELCPMAQVGGCMVRHTLSSTHATPMRCCWRLSCLVAPHCSCSQMVATASQSSGAARLAAADFSALADFLGLSEQEVLAQLDRHAGTVPNSSATRPAKYALRSS